jgi:hypothetical protein
VYLRRDFSINKIIFFLFNWCMHTKSRRKRKKLRNESNQIKFGIEYYWKYINLHENDAHHFSIIFFLYFPWENYHSEMKMEKFMVMRRNVCKWNTLLLESLCADAWGNLNFTVIFFFF